MAPDKYFKSISREVADEEDHISVNIGGNWLFLKEVAPPNTSSTKHLAKCIVEEKQINKDLNNLLRYAYDTLWQWRNNLSVSVDQVDELIKEMQRAKKDMDK